MEKITGMKDEKMFKIYIDGTLHLAINLEKLIGVYSWFDAKSDPNKVTISLIYVVEFSFTSEPKVIAEYDNRKLWKKILTLVDQMLQ